MSSACHYLIHGLVLSSTVVLPLPETDNRTADITYEVTLGKSLPRPRFSRSDNPDDPWFVEHWLGNRVAVEFPGWATFEISRERVFLVNDDAHDPDLLIHLLLDHIIPRVVSLRGDLMLHASGVVGPSGRAHLFLGATGSGKSTIAAALSVSGWALLDDDGIRVTETAGVLMALPGSPGVRLLPDSAATLLADADTGRPLSRENDKRRFSYEGHLTAASVPSVIGSVYVLERFDGSAGPAVHRLGLAEALSSITEHGFHTADEPEDITRHAFERVSALATVVPTWRLRMPDNLGRVGETVSLLAALDADPAT